ncbi:MAG: DUF5317 domain-containing protein [Peptoniphilaceae bacterium]
MIIEAIIIGLIIVKYLNKNFDSIYDFKLKGMVPLSLGVFILILLNIFTRINFGVATIFFIKNYYIIHIMSLLIMSLALFLNYKNLGIVFIALGMFLNTIPIILNGKMPVSLKALEKIDNKKILEIIKSGNSLSHGIFSKAKAYFLSDIIAITKPYPMPKVISIGDIIISVGIILFFYLISRRR